MAIQLKELSLRGKVEQVNNTCLNIIDEVLCVFEFGDDDFLGNIPEIVNLNSQADISEIFDSLNDRAWKLCELVNGNN